MPYSVKSLLFDGVTEYVTMGDVLGYEYTADFSVACWFKCTSSGAGGFCVSKQESSGNYRGFAMGIYGGGGYVVSVHLRNTNPGNRIYVESTTNGLDDDAWHLLVVTWKGNVVPAAADLKIYLDGVLETPNNVVDTLSATIITTAPFNVGGRNNADAFWDGNLDDPAVYNVELSADEVWQIWNGGWPTDLNDVRMPSNLVSWWPIDGDTFPTNTDNAGSNDGTMSGGMIAGDIVDDATNPWAFDYDGLPPDFPGLDTPVWTAPSMSTSFTGVGGIIRKYKMRAQDDGVALPGYVTWVATDDPDFAGAGFSGGTPTPVGSMIAGSATVVAEWEE